MWPVFLSKEIVIAYPGRVMRKKNGGIKNAG